MATILLAKCVKCEYKKKNLRFGGLLNTFENECMVPAFDIGNNSMVVKNYFNKFKLKENIKFYDENSLYKGEINMEETNSYLQWLDVKIKKEENKCPSCHNYGLQFEVVDTID